MWEGSGVNYGLEHDDSFARFGYLNLDTVMKMVDKPTKIVMYADGGSRGNPGPAAVGVYVPTLSLRFGAQIGHTTNNDAEYQALIAGLKKLKSVLGKKHTKTVSVECFLDSELIVRQLNHQYKISDTTMQAHFITVWNLMLDFAQVTITHVRREDNTIADAEVNIALNKLQYSRYL